MTLARWSVRSSPTARRVRDVAQIALLRTLFSMASLSDDSSAASPAARAATSAAGTQSDAFEAFFWQHEREILGYLWRLTGDEQAAYDLSQEAFLRAWQHFERVQSYDQPRAWLFRVASNLGLNHLRGRSRRAANLPTTPSTPHLELLTANAQASDPAQRLAEHDAIREALLRLPPRQRAAVVLCDVYGLTSAEAAATLELSHGSLKMSLWRGRERFRQEYTRKGDAE